MQYTYQQNALCQVQNTLKYVGPLLFLLKPLMINKKNVPNGQPKTSSM